MEKRFVVENVEEDSLIKERTVIFNGIAPHVTVKTEKCVGNKKVTQIFDFELFHIDANELQTYLSNKCAASATV